jgi:cytoskeletal protein CcmA (bactofilin family)
MFTKRSDREPTAFDSVRPVSATPPGIPVAASPTPSVRPAGKSPQSQIGADLTIIGNLVSKGEIYIDGEVQGDVQAVSIVVGESARITGAIVADDIVVRGSVMGSLRGRRVSLQSSSKVEGDIYHTQLGIEQGAYFEGKSRRSDDPIGGREATGDFANGRATT